MFKGPKLLDKKDMGKEKDDEKAGRREVNQQMIKAETSFTIQTDDEN